MTEAVTVALISGLCVAVPSVITTMFSNNKANTLMNYRIDELTKKVEKHNNVVERMALQERETKAIWKRIDEIKEELEKDYDEIVNQKVLKDWYTIYDSKYSPSNYGDVKIETQWENW